MKNTNTANTTIRANQGTANAWMVAVLASMGALAAGGLSVILFQRNGLSLGAGLWGFVCVAQTIGAGVRWARAVNHKG